MNIIEDGRTQANLYNFQPILSSTVTNGAFLTTYTVGTVNNSTIIHLMFLISFSVTAAFEVYLTINGINYTAFINNPTNNTLYYVVLSPDADTFTITTTKTMFGGITPLYCGSLLYRYAFITGSGGWGIGNYVTGSVRYYQA